MLRPRVPFCSAQCMPAHPEGPHLGSLRRLVVGTTSKASCKLHLESASSVGPQVCLVASPGGKKQEGSSLSPKVRCSEGAVTFFVAKEQVGSLLVSSKVARHHLECHSVLFTVEREQSCATWEPLDHRVVLYTLEQ